MINAIIVINLGTLVKTVFSLPKDEIEPPSNLYPKDKSYKRITYVGKENNIKAVAEDKVIHQIKYTKLWKIK